MPPEALKFRRFSFEGDMWSLGVVLHELFSLGEDPYPSLRNRDVSHDEMLAHLKAGNQMDQPEYATTEM